MSRDVLEERLRQALRDGETSVMASADLAVVTAARGRGVLRRRRLIAAASLAGAVAVVLAVGAVLLPQRSPSGEPPATGSDDAPGSVQGDRWVMSLPTGASPRTAYVAGTTVYLPGHVVRLRQYVDVTPIGEAVAGTVVLGRQTEVSSEYLLIGSDGHSRAIAAGTANGATGAAVSPDGRYLAHGRDIMNVSTLSEVAHLPHDAVEVTGWTSAGVAYLDKDQREWLWEPGGQPWRLDHLVWFPGPTSVGVRLSGECPRVVLVHSRDDLTESANRCAAADILTVSPDGRWLLTKDLQVIDARDGSTRWLAHGPLAGPTATSEGTVWEDDTHLLASVPVAGTSSYPGVEALVRCEVSTGVCERATGQIETPGSHSVELSAVR
jgi:hypothetical protein